MILGEVKPGGAVSGITLTTIIINLTYEKTILYL